MLHVLTLSTLFPNAAQPVLGVFVERQTLGLAALPGVEVRVVAPIGLPPAPLHLHPHYRSRAALPLVEHRKGLLIHRPRYRVLPRVGEAGTARSMARALLPLLRDIRGRFPFDVIDAEFFWPDGPAAMLLSRALGVPFSIKARGADIQYWGGRPRIGPQLLEASRAAGGLLSVSAALRRSMIGLGMPGERIAVHYTGVDLARFVPIDRAAAKAALGVSGPLLVTAGALIARKNQRLTLAALERLPEATLLIIGDGPDRSELERIAQATGVASRVRFLRSRPHAELPALLGAADVMILPSLSEGLANVWVESLACGTPIVISDVGGARELVTSHAAGRITDFGAGQIADAVRAILADPPAPAAARSAAESFTWERNARQLRDHLERVTRT
jgi:glycosyltransferase involved in cell wall biosynthesis